MGVDHLDWTRRDGRAIVAAVERHLGRKRFTAAPVGTTADVMVSYRVRPDRHVQVVALSGGWGPHGGGPGAVATGMAQDVLAIRLRVELRDAASRLIWAGESALEIDPNASAERRNRRIDGAVGRVVKAMPPAR